MLGGTIVLLIVANTQDLSQSSGQPDDSVSTIKLVLGLLLVCRRAPAVAESPEGG